MAWRRALARDSGTMAKRLSRVLLLGLVVGAAGCGPAASAPVTATQPEGITTAVAPATATATTLTENCNLLSSREAAGFFATAEVEGPVHHVETVDHPAFTTETIWATESSCIFYVFHLPGSKDMKLLQITYWVDLPGPVKAGAWALAWTEASGGAAESVPGIGDGAFFQAGRLSFRKGSAYFTVEAVGTDLQTDTVAGQAQQRDIEKQVAQDMLGRLE
jgi:hypothetical protein